MKKLRGQISESRRLAILLAVSGGFMDAYTYTFRGEVFANAQTGNIIFRKEILRKCCSTFFR